MKNTPIANVQLEKGLMEVYDFGTVKLHAFKTNDPIADECFLIEKNGSAFLIEAPCFFDNIKELEKYIADKALAFEGTVIAYHAAGASFMKGAPVYSTRNADDYNHKGGGAAIVAKFEKNFGAAFDRTLYTTTHFIESGTLTLAGVEMKITGNQDAFDIEIPEINAVYTHMLGHDVHSIVAGSGHADAVIAALNGYIEKNVTMILTSHYRIENLADVQTKIAYLNDLKNIAGQCSDATAFKAAVAAKYPEYSGENYLDMTAGMFFPQK